MGISLCNSYLLNLKPLNLKQETMKKTLFFCIAFITIISFGFSQERFVSKPKYSQLFKTLPELTTETPTWIKLLYSNEPNYFEISDAFHKYYKNNVFKKNTHTQNFKHFSKIIKAQEYLLEDGSIYIPTVEEKALRDQKILKSRNVSSSSKSAAIANWTGIGPFETFEGGGVLKKSSQSNTYAFDQSISNPNVLYNGSETSGVYKSIDKGLNWFSVGDDIFNDGGVQSVEVDPTNENIVYVGVGNKLYKTTDGGTNWTTLLDVWNLQISAITISSANPQIVLIAGTTGLRRSTDGGANWSTIYTDRCWDIQLKTNDPSTVFLAKQNTTKNITEIFKSTDNGATFILKNTGWFSPVGGVASNDAGARIAVTNADADRVYVILIGEENDAVDDNNFIGIYRSDDAAENWTTPYDGNNDGFADNEPGGPYSNDHWCFTHFGVTTTGYNQGYYDLDIAVSDTDANDVLVGSLNLFKSEDGGVTYIQWGGYGCTGCGTGYRHPDIQEIEINGNDVWVCSDGGIDYYDGNLNRVEARNNGINGSDYWGFDQGWNHDVLVGGRYHNGNAAYYQDYPTGKFLSLGGAESATGYVNKGENRKVYHSDISGKEIPTVITGTISNLSGYGMYPNEHYWLDRRSEIVNDPRYWNTLYLGKENKLWKSDNGGLSFTLVKEFGTDVDNLVKAIEVSRSNPDVIFVTQKEGSNGKLWKSTDTGVNWSDVVLPANHQTMYLSLNTDDELFLGLNNGGTSANKIFKSDDLGGSWSNLSTSTLNGETIENIQVQDGTVGGIYLTSNKVIWYRNNTHADWQLFSDNLPVHLRINKILPFYKNEKVRIASNRGIWESDFFETSLPKAQPMVATKTVNCDRVIVQFEDFSILDHSGASWEWQFPGATTVSSTTDRNPQVTYTATGTYDVTLKITDGLGNISTKTVTDIVAVGDNYCAPEPDPQMALECSANNHFVTNTSVNETGITNFSFTGWIKPNGIQPDYSGVFSLSEGCVLNFREGNNTLGIHWKGGTYWWWDSNLELPANEWSYVAITVTPTEITLFVNEAQHTWSLTTTPFDLTEINMGTYYGWTSRNFKGLIEEATFWKKTLTDQEVKLARHLTKNDVSDPDIIAYYQFNHDSAGTIYDKKGTSDLGISGGAVLVSSDAPVGPGTSSVLTVNSGGVVNFAAAECDMTFAGAATYPNGEVVVSKININPSALPSTNVIDNTYWVVNNYGTNTAFTALSNITFSNITNVETLTAANVQLYKRNSNSDSSIAWGTNIETSTIINAGNKSAEFTNSGTLNSFSQFYIGSAIPLAVDDVVENEFIIYPNPVKEGENVYFHNLKDKAKFTMYDMSGKQVLKTTIDTQSKTRMPYLSEGVYLYSVETNTKIKNGKLVVKSK